MTVKRPAVGALSVARATPRVLVVDDDPDTGHVLATIGEREGFRVVSVDDARKAYRMLRSDAEFVAAVLKMPSPQLRGVELISYMKSEKRLMRIPIVIVAGDQGLKLITESFAAGALLFLPKPFSPDKLLRTVRLAMGSGKAHAN